MATLSQIRDALAAQISSRLSGEIAGLQVDGHFIKDATPPTIDTYPDDEFQTAFAFGKGNNEFRWIVRARTHMADNIAGQDLLLSMMEPDAATSVAQAIMYDRTLGGTIGKINVISTSGFQLFGLQGRELMGCTWTVQVIR